MIELLTTERVPEWAICWLWNGDEEGLSEEELAEARKWNGGLRKFAKENRPKMRFTGLLYEFANCDSGGEARPYFTYYPAFGERNKNALTRRGEHPFLGCEVYDINVYATYNLIKTML